MWTDLGRSVGVTMATQLVLFRHFRPKHSTTCEKAKLPYKFKLKSNQCDKSSCVTNITTFQIINEIDNRQIEHWNAYTISVSTAILSKDNYEQIYSLSLIPEHRYFMQAFPLLQAWISHMLYSNKVFKTSQFRLYTAYFSDCSLVIRIQLYSQVLLLILTDMHYASQDITQNRTRGFQYWL